MLIFKISKAAEMSYNINTKEFSDVYIKLKDFKTDKKQIAKTFGIPIEYVVEVSKGI